MSYRIHTADAGPSGNVQAAVVTPHDTVTVAGYLADLGAQLVDDVEVPAVVLVDMVGQDALVITGTVEELIELLQPVLADLTHHRVAGHRHG